MVDGGVVRTTVTDTEETTERGELSDAGYSCGEAHAPALRPPP
jgi:hypothetical protein